MKNIVSFLTIILALTIFLPINVLNAEGDFRFVKLTGVSEGGSEFTYQNGAVSPRWFDQLILHFNRDLNFASMPGALSFKNSTGEEVPLKITYGYENKSYLQLNSPLEKNKIYTMTIKGGMNGVKDKDGIPLTSEVKLVITTDDKPVFKKNKSSFRVQSFDSQHVAIYRFSAEKGPLKVIVGNIELTNAIRVMVEDRKNQTVISGMTVPGAEKKELLLPYSGDFNLVLVPINNGKLEINGIIEFVVEGLELSMADTVVPYLETTISQPYETLNKPFEVGLAVDPDQSNIKVYLNDKLIHDLKKRETSLTVDPSNLKDGIHLITVAAERPESKNLAVTSWNILVDRINTFKDVSTTHWAHKPVEVMGHLEILNGRGIDSFSPDEFVTREEFAKMMSLTLGLKTSANMESRFIDVGEEAWSKPYIIALTEGGLIEGEKIDGKDYFHPKQAITRAEAVTILGRYFDIENVDITNAKIPFTDFSNVPNWAKSSVLILSHESWIDGFEDGHFYPNLTLTRAQAAKVLYKFLL